MKIAIYAFDGVAMFHLSVPQMVFDEVARQELAEWETTLYSDRAGSIRTAEGDVLIGVYGLDAPVMLILPSSRRGSTTAQV